MAKGNFNIFKDLIKDQFEYGGKKYAFNNKRESTDILFDTFSKNWLYGTISKYVKRIKNLERQRDFLKIATYSMILWLKRGFHINPQGTKKPIDTTVEIKNKYFPKFIELAKEYLFTVPDEKDNLEVIERILKRLANKPFSNVYEAELMEIYIQAYYAWKKKILEKNGDITDTDTWLENKG